MTTMMVHGVRIDYIVEGEGFPCVLMPELQGTLELWAPYLPLLGEMCRTLAYHLSGTSPSAPGMQEAGQLQDFLALDAILEAFHLERVYIASPWRSWHCALQYGLTAPERVEAFLLVGLSSTDSLTCLAPAALPCRAPFARMQVPTLLLTGDAPAPGHKTGEALTRILPRCTRVVLPSTAFLPVPSASLQPGHAMMRFLTHCERQRTLVRGASFLL